MSAGRIPHLDLGPVAAFGGTIVLPGSKSISNRTLLLAGLAEGGTELKGVLASDDTERMLDALNALGVPWIRKPDSDDYLIQGAGGYFPIKQADLFMGNAGTAIRPLTAVLALGGGHYKLSGVPRMHERPIGDLVDALRQLGADIRYNGKEGYPPLELVRAEIQVPEVISVRGDVSSQFLTALLLALPLTGQAARVEVVGELISKPYVEITLNMMRRFGVEVEREGWQVFRLPAGQQYRSPGQLHVEGDASSASYFLAAAAIKGGPVRIEGIGRDSIQGDVRFAEVVEQMGAEVKLGDGFIEVQGKGLPLQAIDADLNHIPDAAMTAAVMALFADGPSTLRNIASWRVKETDRLSAMATELRKVGAEVEEGPDFLRIVPPRELRGATIDTYDDHRMAMCFSLVALGGVAVRINDPECVNKTFPEYFSEFERLAQR